MPAGQEIALEPALTLMLAQHLHDTSIRREVIVVGNGLGDPGAVRHVEHVLPAVGVVLVRTEQAEVARREVELHHVAQVVAHNPRRLRGHGAGGGNLDGVVAEVRQPQVVQQGAAVRVRIGAHPARPRRRQRGQFGFKAAGRVEQLLGPVALHPAFEDAHVLGVAPNLAHRHLMRAPVAFLALAVDLLRAGPALRGAHDDHRPDGPLREAVGAGNVLDAPNVVNDLFQRRRHQLVHGLRVVALDEMRRVAVAAHQGFELFMRDARENRRIGDLVAVEVQDWQHGAVAHGIEELVRVPARGERPGLGFAVAYRRRRR